MEEHLCWDWEKEAISAPVAEKGWSKPVLKYDEQGRWCVMTTHEGRPKVSYWMTFIMTFASTTERSINVHEYRVMDDDRMREFYVVSQRDLESIEGQEDLEQEEKDKFFTAKSIAVLGYNAENAFRRLLRHVAALQTIVKLSAY